MQLIDFKAWNRKSIYNHFKDFEDPYFGIIASVEVTKAYKKSQIAGYSFFARYLHDCMKAINEVSNLKYRIINEQVVEFDVIHASATIARADQTFGCSFIEFNEDIQVFIDNIKAEKQRVESTDQLLPVRNGQDCIHCSALPWIQFIGHKEPRHGAKDSVPKLGYSKAYLDGSKLMMNVSIDVHHGLADGYHVGLFLEQFQRYLNG